MELVPERRGLLLVFGGAVVLATALRLAFAFALVPDGLGDDGYITLRYAANLAEGKGFVYNPGEPVWGTTTPLFTLLLWAGAALFGVSALEASALAIGIAASVGFWVLTAILLEEQKIPRPVTALVLLLILFSPPYFANSILGMETPVVLVLMALSLYWYVHNRAVPLGLTFALLLMTRIDTLVWIGILGGGFILRHGRTEPRAVLLGVSAFLIASLPWNLYAYVTFGSIIPQSVVGKAVSHGAFSGPVGEYFLRLYHVYFPVGWLGRFAWAGVLGTAALVLVGFRALWKDYPLLRPVGVFLFAFGASFLAGRAPLYMWYFPPSQWVAVLLLGLGLYAVWSMGLAAASRPAVRLAPFGVLAACVLTYGVYGVAGAWQQRTQNRYWAELGEFVRTTTPQDSRVFLEHIGLVGYKSGRPILDNMGLVSPEIVPLKVRYPVDYAWLRVALTRMTPEVVVLYPAQDPNVGPGSWSDEERAWFGRHYRLTRRIDSNPTSYVYFRSDLAAPAGEGPPGEQAALGRN
jgi:hypothetical protein